MLPLLFLLLAVLTSARQWRSIDDALLPLVAQMQPEPWTDVTSGHLGRMLIPRVAGTENNTIVREYIKSVFRDLAWHVEEDAFTATTPEGDVEFVNVVATFDTAAPIKVVLAAHHDSKWFEGREFLGATDSAAPCAMLLDLAQALTPALRARKTRLTNASDDEDDEDDFDEREAAQTTLQIVFFDGEEAFHDWTATDSIYGSRHLASHWESTFLPPNHPYHSFALTKRRMDPTPTVLSTIEHLVLLDLLGSPAPTIMQWYRETGWLFNEMKRADERLRASGVVKRASGGEWFSPLSFGGTIEDDQVPFIERGVNVLHVIPYPFPSVWHTIKGPQDDASALDLPTMRRWNLILRLFTLEYLGLDPTGNLERAERSEEPWQSRHELT
ncbi:hypothetical protein QFC20_004689 [Naganishia adeliensis]|uniref:Uncharacterized protein n=1 Tax=Naganishia adeliensis TaxID=92952 RepID=A0ACC2VX45_9TREE|nr:hypothetical protein QFC20_004689 [Naganishia adeliensis]